MKLFFAIILFLLVACSNNGGGNTSYFSSSLSGSQYKVIEDAIAQTKIPINPQRIVTLHGAALESVLALNGKLIGTTLNGDLEQQPDYLKDRLSNIEILGSFDQPNLEKMLLIKPDLILDLDTGIPTSIYQQLSQIAPIVVAEYDTGDSWKQNLQLYAEALGKPEVAQEIIANYYARLEKFKTEMGDRLKQTKVSVVRIYPQGISFYQKDSFSGSILSDAGLSRPPLQNHKGIQQFISKELIDEADADVIFIWTYGDDYNSDDEKRQNILDDLKLEPLWLQLNAVRQGKVYQVPDYWIGFGPLAANAVIDDLFKYLGNNLSP